MTHKSLPQRLDDSVRWTGIPRLAQATPPRFHLRWLPIVALSLGTLGLGIVLSGVAKMWLGWSVLMLGFMIGNFLPIFGPIKPWGALDGVDERERLVRRDAYFFAFAVIAVVAFLGQLTLAGLVLAANWPRDHLLEVMVCGAMYLMLLYASLPTLHASWATRPPAFDD